MKHIIVIILLSLFFLDSCCENTDYLGSGDIKVMLKPYDPKLVNHFPRDLSYSYKVYFSSFPDKRLKTQMGVWLIAEYDISDKINIDSLINYYSSTAIKKCYHNDSCNLILPKRSYHDRTIGRPKITACSDKKDIIPVPLFEKVHPLDSASSEFQYLPQSYTLFVLDVKPGKYIDDNLLLKEGYMPEEWKHGYSKGVVINKEKREAIYWIEIW